MRESDILYEKGNYWVARGKVCYTVFKTGVCVSASDSTYAQNRDGLSLAKARVDYLAGRARENGLRKC